MKLFDMLSHAMHQEANLLTDIKLDNGETRYIGDKVSVLLDLGNGKYHVEDNDFSCTVNGYELDFINEIDE